MLNDERVRELIEYRGDGLACFCASDFFQAYRVPIRLEEQLFVHERFHIRPLLPLLRSDARLYILALTQETAKLYEATRYSIREVELPGLNPLEVDGDEQALQYHSHNAPVQGRDSTEAAIYHGHGGLADREKKDILRYFQFVDREVTRVLQGQRSPLVLACVGYLASMYESANRYKHLINGKVPGSPDRWSKDELRQRAWKLVEPFFGKRNRKLGKNCNRPVVTVARRTSSVAWSWQPTRDASTRCFWHGTGTLGASRSKVTSDPHRRSRTRRGRATRFCCRENAQKWWRRLLT